MLLTLSTATGFPSCAILHKNKVYQLDENLKDKIKADYLPVKIKDLLDKQNLDFKSIESVIIDTGPGSLTGIRAGISYVVGLNVFSSLDILSVNSFDLLFFGFLLNKKNIFSSVDSLLHKTETKILEELMSCIEDNSKSILLLIPSHKGEYYSRFYNTNNLELEFEKKINNQEVIDFINSKKVTVVLQESFIPTESKISESSINIEVNAKVATEMFLVFAKFTNKNKGQLKNIINFKKEIENLITPCYMGNPIIGKIKS